MSEGRKILRGIFSVLVVFSFFVTGVVGFLFVTNYKNIAKMWDVSNIIKAEYLGTVTDDQLMLGAIKGMVESLNDPYSVYLSADKYKEFTQHVEGAIGGIGVTVGILDEKIVVYSVINDTPAAKVGVQKGDVIFKVNDLLISELELDEIITKMRGEPGTQLELTVIREGKLKEFTLIREKINLPTVESKVLADQIGYLYLSQFATNSDEALAKHLLDLKKEKIKGLVLDLRDNPGGELGTTLNIAKYFVPEGPVVYILNNDGSIDEKINHEPVELGVPLVVLINGGSASASEILAGAIKDTKSGILVGETTYGKAMVQHLIEIRKEDALKLTTAKYLTPNQHDIQGRGIKPDVMVEFTAGDEEDKQLNKALELLKKQIK